MHGPQLPLTLLSQPLHAGACSVPILSVPFPSSHSSPSGDKSVRVALTLPAAITLPSLPPLYTLLWDPPGQLSLVFTCLFSNRFFSFSSLSFCVVLFHVYFAFHLSSPQVSPPGNPSSSSPVSPSPRLLSLHILSLIFLYVHSLTVDVVVLSFVRSPAWCRLPRRQACRVTRVLRKAFPHLASPLLHVHTVPPPSPYVAPATCILALPHPCYVCTLLALPHLASPLLHVHTARPL